MATRHSDRISLTAAADLSAQTLPIFIKVNGDNGGDKCGAGGDAIGTSEKHPTSGAPFEVYTGPRVPITIGTGPLTAGAEVMSDANGKAVAWVTANRSLGFVLEGGATGDVVAMLFAPNGRKA